jgi:hypothetical protein
VPTSLPIAPERSLKNQLLAQRNPNCRRIIAGRSIGFYSSPNTQGGSFGSLFNGDRVELVSTTTIQGTDGRIFLQVRYPFNRREQNTGFILTRYEVGNGETRPTLGTCPIKAWW